MSPPGGGPASHPRRPRCHSQLHRLMMEFVSNAIWSAVDGPPSTLYWQKDLDAARPTESAIHPLQSTTEEAMFFFYSTTQPRPCLRHLLPPPRDPVLLSRLRAPSKFPNTNSRTKSANLLYPACAQ